MNCEELQINDWVEYNGLNQKVKEISGLDNEVYLTIDECIDCTQVNPILITPEILEKNGFRLVGEKFVFGEIDDDLVELNLSINNSYRIHISVADLMIGHSGWIEYVHQLQHALRLCGIEKEIQL